MILLTRGSTSDGPPRGESGLILSTVALGVKRETTSKEEVKERDSNSSPECENSEKPFTVAHSSAHMHSMPRYKLVKRRP